MRKVFLLLLLLVMIKPYSWSQNNQLIGLITYQNTGEPVEGVSITPSEGASPTSSNDLGQFTLKFPGKSPGKVVKLILVKLQYQVVGIDPMIVDIALRQEAGDVVRIVMVKKEEYEQREDRYEKSIEKRLAEQKEEILFLRSRLTENQLSDTERRGLTQQIGALTEQVETLEKNKEELAKRLAQVDLDQASSFARQALKSFEVGNLEEALSLMDDEKLDDFWNNVARQEEKVKRAKRQGVENYMIKARLLAANGQNDDAYQNYLKAVERDSVHVYNLWELAYFCGERNQQKRAISFYQRAVSYADSESEKADLLNNLGGEFKYNNAYGSAESAYKEALEIYQRLAKANPERYNLYLANALKNIGYLHKALLEQHLNLAYQSSGLAYAKQAEAALSLYSTDIPIVKNYGYWIAELISYFESVTEEDFRVQTQINKALLLEEKNETETDPAKRAANQVEVVNTLENIWRQYPENTIIIPRLANAYGALAWYQLFNRHFLEVEQAARKGMDIDPSQEWINTNLALGLLFQGKYEEAEDVYVSFKERAFNDAMTFKTAFLQDLADLEAAGITHPDVEKVRELLQK